MLTANYNWDIGYQGKNPWWDNPWVNLWNSIDTELYKRTKDLFMQGKMLYGSDQSGGDLILKSTSHVTKGKIYFGANAYYDETNDLFVSAPDKGLKLQTQEATPFSVHVGSAVFNGVRDSVLYLAYNLLPGSTATRITLTEPQLKFGMEANFYDGVKNLTEFNLDYVSSDGLTTKRFFGFNVNRATHIGQWGFASDWLEIRSNNDVAYAKFTAGYGLDITGLVSITTTPGNRGLEIQDGVGVQLGSYFGGSSVGWGTLSNHPLGIMAGADYKAWITITGLVGIGNLVPGLRLDVKGVEGAPAASGTTQTGIARFLGTTSKALDFGIYSASPYGLWLQTTNTGDLSLTYPLILNPKGGNVGVKITNPSQAFECGGFIKSSGGGFIIGADTESIQDQGANILSFFTAGTERLRITNAGKITIQKEMGLTEMNAPAGVANQATIYAVDNGAGKTQLMVIFASGVAQQIAIEA